MKHHGWMRPSIGTPVAVLALLGLALGAGCTMPKLPLGKGDPGTTVWRAFDQYVRIEPQDTAGAPNGHPLTLSQAQVHALLAPISVVDEARPDRGAIPVLSKRELAELSGPIAEALGRAKSGEDVTFASIGMHPGILTLERRLTTGRVFHRDGRLNIIFGTVHGVFDDDADRRLVPFLPGSRSASARSTWKIVRQSGQEQPGPDGVGRADWIALDLAGPQAHGHEPLRTTAEAQRMHPGVEAAATPVRPAAPPDPSAAHVIEQRLSVLKGLRAKGLITEREYQTRRRAILDEI